jgi:hypothetical protein
MYDTWHFLKSLNVSGKEKEKVKHMLSKLIKAEDEV